MKRTILLMIVICLFFGSIKGQNLMDSLKVDTIELYQNVVVIKYLENFHKKKLTLEYGGTSISYASQPPISVISVIEEANTEMKFGDKCIITSKTELEDFYTEKGICPLKGYYRSDYYKGTRIIISYANVSECEHSLFDYILDSVIIVSLSSP